MVFVDGRRGGGRRRRILPSDRVWVWMSCLSREGFKTDRVSAKWDEDISLCLWGWGVERGWIKILLFFLGSKMTLCSSSSFSSMSLRQEQWGADNQGKKYRVEKGVTDIWIFPLPPPPLLPSCPCALSLSLSLYLSLSLSLSLSPLCRSPGPAFTLRRFFHLQALDFNCFSVERPD